MYVRDLASGLLERGHTPVVYSPRLGPVAEELRRRTIPVTDDLNSVTAAPDIIHAHHNLEAMTALLRFPHAPAVFFAHDNMHRRDVPPHFPRILRYVAVDQTCLDRLIYEHGIPAERALVIYNSVDLRRFRPRPPLPAKPSRALVFSNASSVHVEAVRAACDRSGLALDVVGQDSGNVCDKPEEILGRYDIVFAKARCALEAMAVGAAVVLCDYRGAGPLVTAAEFDNLRRPNFGHRALGRPLRPDVIAREIARYDAADAAEVSRRVRADAGLDRMVDSLVELYEEVIAEYAGSAARDDGEEMRAASDYLRWLTLRLNEEQDARDYDEANALLMRMGRPLKRIPVVGAVARSLKEKLLGPRRPG
jgi:hypothetical protein